MYDIVSLGDNNVDFIALIEEYPEKGGNAWGKGFEVFPGGTAVNTSIMASALGLKSAYLGKMGIDKLSDILIETLQTNSVDISMVKRSNNPTGAVFIVVDRMGERTFFALRSECADTKLKREEVGSLDTRVLYVSGVSLIEGSSREAALLTMRDARRLKVLTAFDPNLRIEGNEIPADVLSAIKKALSFTDILLTNENDIKLITNRDKIEAAVNETMSFGPTIGVVKKGEEGCEILKGEEKIDVKSFPIRVVDTTGAGDGFNAGFIKAYIEGKPLRSAGIFANAAGALVSTYKGATTEPPEYENVINFLKNNGIKW